MLIAMVPQTATLFNDTIVANVRYGNESTLLSDEATVAYINDSDRVMLRFTFAVRNNVAL